MNFVFPFAVCFVDHLNDLGCAICVIQEARRIRNEHPDDASAIANDRVKGSLKVTRAFGAGFLKQVWIISSESS